MKDKQLLSVMFSDAEEFRGQLLSETLRRVRRKRRLRQTGQLLIILAIVGAAAWWSIPQRTMLDAPMSSTASVQIVRTFPLPPDRIVASRPDSVAIIGSDKSTVALLEDEQLLDVVPGETKLLVWHAPHQAELLVIGP